MKIKAIETEYNSYKFRSRLEARWAVFFDSLGIEYDYEPEGFDLGDAGWYLPDFWLPGRQMWAEVKGVEIAPKERNKAKALSRATEYPVLLLVGSPKTKSYTVLEWMERHTGPEYWAVEYSLTAVFNRSSRDVDRAVLAARQARFEHGQVGAPKDWTRAASTLSRLAELAKALASGMGKLVELVRILVGRKPDLRQLIEKWDYVPSCSDEPISRGQIHHIEHLWEVHPQEVGELVEIVNSVWGTDGIEDWRSGDAKFVIGRLGEEKRRAW